MSLEFLVKHLQGRHDQKSHGRAGGRSSASRAELEAQGYIPVFRGTGPQGLKSIRPSQEGVLGPGVYFYDSADQAKTFAERGGGIVTGFVHPRDVRIENIPGGTFSSPHRVVVVQDTGKFIRRGDIPTSDTDVGFSKEARSKWQQRVDQALEEAN